MRIGPATRAPQIATTDIAPAEWNLVIMACADNDLDSWMKLSMKRIERVGSLPGKTNVIALIDGHEDDPAVGWTKRTRLMLMQRDPSNRTRFISSEIAVDPTSDLGRLFAEHGGELNTGDGKTLKALLDYVRERIPSKYLATCIKNHGMPRSASVSIWTSVPACRRATSFDSPTASSPKRCAIRSLVSTKPLSSGGELT